MPRYLQIILIMCFLVTISTPLTLFIVEDDKAISANEKRRLEKFPEVHLDSSLLNQFPDQFNNYFNDHYGLRSEMVLYNQELKRILFNSSSVSAVVRGNEDWLFFDTADSLFDHVGLIVLDDKVLRDWQQTLLDKKQWLGRMGIRYMFVPVPNKMTIYSEFLPYRIRRYAGVTMLDQLLTFLAEHGEFDDYIELEPIYSKYKETHPKEKLYFRTDSHWTSLGAYLAYKETMLQLQIHFPNRADPLQYNRDIEQRVLEAKRGDLARMVAADEQQTEDNSVLIPRSECAGTAYQEVLEFQQTDAYAIRKKRLPIANGCPEKGLTAVIVHDSFGSYVRQFFSESFKRVIFMHSYDLVGMKSFLLKERPDIYIDIRAERSVKYLLQPDPRLKQDLQIQ